MQGTVIFPDHPKGVQWVFSSTPTLADHVFKELTLYIGTLPCWNMFGSLVPMKGNLKSAAYKDILENCVFPTLW